jgi:hypothetical protein
MCQLFADYTPCVWHVLQRIPLFLVRLSATRVLRPLTLLLRWLLVLLTIFLLRVIFAHFSSPRSNSRMSQWRSISLSYVLDAFLRVLGGEYVTTQLRPPTRLSGTSTVHRTYHLEFPLFSRSLTVLTHSTKRRTPFVVPADAVVEVVFPPTNDDDARPFHLHGLRRAPRRIFYCISWRMFFNRCSCKLSNRWPLPTLVWLIQSSLM